VDPTRGHLARSGRVVCIGVVAAAMAARAPRSRGVRRRLPAV